MSNKTLAILKSMSVLYVEDDRETREELAIMLETWVGRLAVAGDGQAGLETFRQFRPDIVVTDIQMPGLNGLAMCEEIRQHVPEQPILVLSAHNDTEYLLRSIELGIDHYVTKPVDVGLLLDKLARIATTIDAIRERQHNHVLLEQYRHLVDQSAVVCKMDPRGIISYVNNKLCEISGFAPRELLGKDIAALRHPSEPADHCLAAIEQAASGRKWTGVVRNRTRDGRMYVVESSLVPILDEHGEVAEIVALDVDISSVHEDYENLVAALNRSHLSLNEQLHFLNEYKRALELGTCICVTDRQARILSVNRQFETLLGYTALDLEGKPIELVAPDLAGEHCLVEAQRNEQEGFTSRILRFRNSHGGELQFSVGCLGIRNPSGEVESIIMLCQDVTESLRLNRDIVETQRDLLYMMGDVVESRSQETAQHVRRVALVSKFLALGIGLDADMASMIETAAPMHDVGKVGIRDAILHKQGRLTPDEFEEMKNHSRIGHSILGKVPRPLVALAATIAHQHHERWDGDGYPYGLKGEDIHIAGRIVAVADVLDALSSPRIYKPAWDEQRVQDYFRDQRGRQFDPQLVDLLLEQWDTIKALREGRITV